MKHENGQNKPGYLEEKMARTKERQKWDKMKILNIIMLALGFVTMVNQHIIRAWPHWKLLNGFPN